MAGGVNRGDKMAVDITGRQQRPGGKGATGVSAMDDERICRTVVAGRKGEGAREDERAIVEPQEAVPRAR